MIEFWFVGVRSSLCALGRAHGVILSPTFSLSAFFSGYTAREQSVKLIISVNKNGDPQQEDDVELSLPLL